MDSLISKFRIVAGMVLFLLALATENLQGQAGAPMSRYNFQLESRVHYGFFIHHHLEMGVFNKHFTGFELALQKSTFGKQQWEVLYQYPLVGVAFWYSPLGGFKEIGQGFALYPYINYPLNRNRDRSIHFRLGLGLGYLTNRFDPIENYKNFAIGSHMNAAVSMYFDFRFRLSDRLRMVAAIGLTHFSNGSMRTPNYGLNIPTANVGFSYFIMKPNPYLDRMLRPQLYPFEFDGKKWFSVEFSAALGFKDMTQQIGQRFLVYNVAANALKQVSPKSKIGIGLDATYDASDKSILGINGIPYDHGWQLIKPGANIAYELLMQKTSFLFNVGMHLGSKEKSEGDVYQKLAVKHLISNNLFASATLTAHFGKAEYIGFGLGYRLDFKYY